MWLGAGFPHLPLQQWSCAGTWGCVVSARHGTAGQPQGFGGLMLIFKIGFLKLVVKHSTSPLSNNNTLKKRNTQRSWIRCVEIRSLVLLVYLFSNTGLIHTTGWCCLSTLSFQLPHTHTHTPTHTLICVLTFSSSVVSCSSSLMGSVPSGNEPLPLSWTSSGKSQGLVDSAISSSVALMTFRTSVDMLQRETAEYFCFDTRVERENSTMLAQRGIM